MKKKPLLQEEPPLPLEINEEEEVQEKQEEQIENSKENQDPQSVDEESQREGRNPWLQKQVASKTSKDSIEGSKVKKNYCFS